MKGTCSPGCHDEADQPILCRNNLNRVLRHMRTKFKLLPALSLLFFAQAKAENVAEQNQQERGTEQNYLMKASTGSTVIGFSPIDRSFGEQTGLATESPMAVKGLKEIYNEFDRVHPQQRSSIAHDHLRKLFVDYISSLQSAASNLNVDVSSKDWVRKLLQVQFRTSDIDRAISLRCTLVQSSDETTIDKLDESLEGLPLIRKHGSHVGDFGAY